MTLTAEMLDEVRETFLTQGYAVARNVIPMEVVEDIQEFLLSQKDAAVEAAQHELGCSSPEALVELAGEIAAGRHVGMETLTKASRDTLTGHYPLAVRLSERLWQIPRTPAVRALLSECLNSDALFMHMPPTARFVLAKNSHAGVPPHQDASYNGHMNRFLTMWTPFVDITDECGGVIVYEGTGQAELQEAPSSPTEYWRKAIETQGATPVHMKIKMGDVLLLNPFIIHGSAANRSDRTRVSIDFRFFGGDGASAKHHLDMQTWRVVEPSPVSH